jgi:hypothetical protein
MVTSTSETSPKERKRRRFQFGMRTLLIAISFSCLGFGWLTRQLQKARERESIVAELDRVGVYVYQYEPTKLGRLTRTSRSFDYWLRTRFGDSLLSTPSAVNAHNIGDDKAEYLLRQLHQFPGLRTVHLGQLSEENDARIRAAFPTVEVQTARGFGALPSAASLQPSGP